MIRLLSAFIFLAGVWLRLHALAQNIRLQPDEAWFSTFARAAALNGDWWLPGPLDKPPLALYANALSQVFVGDHELAVRLPGAIASILLLPVMVAAARVWYTPEAAQRRGGLSVPVMTLILTALSPFALAFSATAYTDGLMLLCMALALWMAGRGRWGGSGLWLGLGFASKSQALFYLPLLLLLGYSTGRLTLRHARRFATGLLVALGLLLLWDAARPGTSLFTLAAVNNDPGRLVRANEILPRLQSWLHHAGALLGPGWLTALLLASGLVVLFYRIFHQPARHNTFVDLSLLIFVLGLLLLHWLVAFNTYDRYLLPLLPPVILLAAQGLTGIARMARLPARLQTALLALLCAALISPALNASESQRPINTEHLHYEGIDQLAAYLNAQPVATVIYDRWLGWELGYYLGQWHDKRLTYYPTPHLLVQDALALCETGPRYFPAPADKMVQPWLEALRAAGFSIEQTYASPQFVAYQLVPPWASVEACPP